VSSSIQGAERVWPDGALERGMPRPLANREKNCGEGKVMGDNPCQNPIGTMNLNLYNAVH
jgi:hypothetical protein